MEMKYNTKKWNHETELWRFFGPSQMQEKGEGEKSQMSDGGEQEDCIRRGWIWQRGILGRMCPSLVLA